MAMSVNFDGLVNGGNSPLNWCGSFLISVTGGGGTIVEEGWAQLNVGGNLVGGKQYWPVGHYAYRPFRSVEPYLSPTFPGEISGSAVPLFDSQIDVNIEFGTRTIDLMNCENNTESTLFSFNQTVAHSLLFAGEELNFAQPQILTRRKGHFFVCRGQTDTFGVWGGLAGTTINKAQDGVAPVNYICGPDRITQIPIEFDADTPVTFSIATEIGFQTIFTVSQKDCCCPSGELVEVQFLENIGGWSTIAFDCIETASVSRQFTDICLADYCANLNKRSSLRNQGSKPQIKLKKYMDNTPETAEFYQEACLSSQYYLKMPPGSSSSYRKMKLVSGEYNVYERDDLAELEMILEPIRYDVLR